MTRIDTSDVGVVVIGRNEGERLKQCLASLANCHGRIVYVDSGSTDGSIDLAKSLGIETVTLARTSGFTAARARNAGFKHLAATAANLRFVQFVDGDCVVDPGWLDVARRTLQDIPGAAIVCGRRRERYPHGSIYNRLCDLEWNTPIGQATECGGDAMMRIDAFQNVGGFNDELIAGEEPELCVRLRAAGWTIQRIDAEMTLHDAAMTRLGQWWNRNVRAGHAFAEGSTIHGKSPLRHWVRQTRSNWVWGLTVPSLAIVLVWPTNGTSLLVWLALEALLIGKIFVNGLRHGRASSDAAILALFTTIGKIPQAIGQMRFVISRQLGQRTRLIEYKSPDVLASEVVSPDVISG